MMAPATLDQAAETLRGFIDAGVAGFMLSNTTLLTPEANRADPGADPADAVTGGSARRPESRVVVVVTRHRAGRAAAGAARRL
jgi:hypothetical protein